MIIIQLYAISYTAGCTALHIMQDWKKIHNIGLLWFIRYPHLNDIQPHLFSASALCDHGCKLQQHYFKMLNWSNNVVQSALIATVFRRMFQPPPSSLLLPPFCGTKPTVSWLLVACLLQTSRELSSKTQEKLTFLKQDDLQSKTWQANVTSGCLRRTVLRSAGSLLQSAA